MGHTMGSLARINTRARTAPNAAYGRTRIAGRCQDSGWSGVPGAASDGGTIGILGAGLRGVPTAGTSGAGSCGIAEDIIIATWGTGHSLENAVSRMERHEIVT